MHISMKVNGKVFGYFYPKRKFYTVATFDAEGDWVEYPIKNDDDLDKVTPILRAWKAKRDPQVFSRMRTSLSRSGVLTPESYTHGYIAAWLLTCPAKRYADVDERRRSIKQRIRRSKVNCPEC